MEETGGIYYLQETIDGWRQLAFFKGTYEECLRVKKEWCHNGSWAIIPENEYDVDYL